MLTTLTLILHSGSRFLGARQDNGRVISGELDKSKDAKILISGALQMVHPLLCEVQESQAVHTHAQASNKLFSS